MTGTLCGLILIVVALVIAGVVVVPLFYKPRPPQVRGIGQGKDDRVKFLNRELWYANKAVQETTQARDSIIQALIEEGEPAEKPKRGHRDY